MPRAEGADATGRRAREAVARAAALDSALEYEKEMSADLERRIGAADVAHGATRGRMQRRIAVLEAQLGLAEEQRRDTVVKVPSSAAEDDAGVDRGADEDAAAGRAYTAEARSTPWLAARRWVADGYGGANELPADPTGAAAGPAAVAARLVNQTKTSRRHVASARWLLVAEVRGATRGVDKRWCNNSRPSDANIVA